MSPAPPSPAPPSPTPPSPTPASWTRAASPFGLFRVGRPEPVEPPAGVLAATRSSMALGPWSCDATGTPTVAALGVLLDEALGFTVFSARPDGAVSVTSELALDVAHPVPADAGSLTVETELVARHDDCGLAACRVVTDTGVLVGLGTTWCRFVPAPDHELDPGYFSPGATPPEALAVADLLGVELHPGGTAGTLRPLGSHANGMGNVHGGVLLSAAVLAGLGALPATPHLTSVRTSYLRPTPLGAEVALRTEVVRAGRSVGVARTSTVTADGRVSTVSTVTARA